MRVVIVAGPAGAGKSTLGRALATELGAALLDLDDLTNSLLDALWPSRSATGHWNDAPNRSLVRPARYAVLRAAASAQVASGIDVVLVAPFTAEMTGGQEWEELTAAIEPVEPVVLWIDVPARVLAERVRARAFDRDDGSAGEAPARPAVPHVALDGRSSTSELVRVVRAGMV